MAGAVEIAVSWDAIQMLRKVTILTYLMVPYVRRKQSLFSDCDLLICKIFF